MCLLFLQTSSRFWTYEGKTKCLLLQFIFLTGRRTINKYDDFSYWQMLSRKRKRLWPKNDIGGTMMVVGGAFGGRPEKWAVVCCGDTQGQSSPLSSELAGGNTFALDWETEGQVSKGSKSEGENITERPGPHLTVVLRSGLTDLLSGSSESFPLCHIFKIFLIKIF